MVKDLDSVYRQSQEHKDRQRLKAELFLWESVELLSDRERQSASESYYGGAVM